MNIQVIKTNIISYQKEKDWTTSISIKVYYSNIAVYIIKIYRCIFWL
jgi:hypothetical protein